MKLVIYTLIVYDNTVFFKAYRFYLVSVYIIIFSLLISVLVYDNNPGVHTALCRISLQLPFPGTSFA